MTGDPTTPQNRQSEGDGTSTFDQAAFAHEIAHGLASLDVNSESALAIVSVDRTELDDADWADLRRHLQAIHEEAQAQVFQALTVIHHLMPHYAAGLLRPEVRLISPMTILREMLTGYVGRAAAKGVSIELEESTEPSEQFPRIELECNTIRRVFHNTLTNAIKYSYSGLPERLRYIKIWAQRHDAENRHWAIKMQNYGIGLHPHELPHAFQPGYRGELARDENTFGTGLGLADVKTCMHAHGGWARIESKQVHHNTYLTTVTLVFPRHTDIRSSHP